MAAPAQLDPMTPRPFRIRQRRKELADTFTLALAPDDGGGFAFQPGQFNMLYAFGVGEIPVSISSAPDEPGEILHTIRAVGKVSAALGALKPGDMVGVRGPFGTSWPVEAAYGSDLVILAGGIGLAPLRPAIRQVIAQREKFGNVVILYGARTPEDILFRKELQSWRGHFDLNVEVTVDRVTGAWGGRVGVVTGLIRQGGFDRLHSIALLCGPEVMMRYGVRALHDCGVASERIYVSMERNMKCAVGFCGHCQFGASFVCKDGPVFPFDRIEKLFAIPEL
ncbi:MAG: Ni/Fe hydrogenase subunit gamma [Candidatus Hydrogenedens sp.]|nr:Ni/Fe hydrogenase subunit gamma [Candidatus Hydrogenedens sp.]